MNKAMRKYVNSLLKNYQAGFDFLGSAELSSHNGPFSYLKEVMHLDPEFCTAFGKLHCPAWIETYRVLRSHGRAQFNADMETNKDVREAVEEIAETTDLVEWNITEGIDYGDEIFVNAMAFFSICATLGALPANMLKHTGEIIREMQESDRPSSVVGVVQALVAIARNNSK